MRQGATVVQKAAGKGTGWKAALAVLEHLQQPELSRHAFLGPGVGLKSCNPTQLVMPFW